MLVSVLQISVMHHCKQTEYTDRLNMQQSTTFTQYIRTSGVTRFASTNLLTLFGTNPVPIALLLGRVLQADFGSGIGSANHALYISLGWGSVQQSSSSESSQCHKGSFLLLWCLQTSMYQDVRTATVREVILWSKGLLLGQRLNNSD